MAGRQAGRGQPRGALEQEGSRVHPRLVAGNRTDQRRETVSLGCFARDSGPLWEAGGEEPQTFSSGGTPGPCSRIPELSGLAIPRPGV